MLELAIGIASTGGVAVMALAGLRAMRAAAEAASRQHFAVTFPRQARPEQVLAFTRSLSGLLPPRGQRLLGSPAVVLEARAAQGQVGHVLSLPAGSAEYVLAQLRAALPGTAVELVAPPPPLGASLALELATTSVTQALRTDDPAHTAAAILATLQPLRHGERAVIQWVVSPAPPLAVPEVVTLREPARGWLGWLTADAQTPVRVPAELVRSQREKRAEPQCVAAVRLGVRTASAARDRQVLRRLLGAFHLATAPGARFQRRGGASSAVARRLDQAAQPVLGWPCRLNAKELASFGGIPTNAPRLAGLTLAAAPQLPPAAAIPARGRVLGTATFPGAERPVALSPAASMRHLEVIGPTGVGKSTLLLNLICGDLAAGQGCVVLDPKGDLISDVIDRVPGGRDDVIVLDPCDAARPVGFNLLAGAAGSGELVADQVVALFAQLFKAFWGPRTDDILRAAILTLVRQPGMTLAEVPTLLTDDRFRRWLIGGLDDHVLEGFWAWYEALSAGERSQAIGPVLNKLRSFLLRKRLRNVIGQSDSTFSLTEVLAKQQVLLVNLSKGVLGEDAARLLGSAVLAQLWQAVQARAALPTAERRPVFCFVDEFQDYVGVPTSFADLLAQARGYGFGLTLAHQGLFQLSTELRQAVLANARSRVVFQAAHSDAVTLARELGPDVDPDGLGALAPFQAVAQVMAAGSVCPPVSLATHPAPAPTGSADRVRTRSRGRYGRDARQVEAALRARAEGSRRAPVVGTRRRS